MPDTLSSRDAVFPADGAAHGATDQLEGTMVKIEAVVFTANQKSYLSMREWNSGGQDACGISRLDDTRADNQPDAGTTDLAGEWQAFRSGFLGGRTGHHAIGGVPGKGARPHINVLEVTEDGAATATWVARGFRELGVSDAKDPGTFVVTDRRKAEALAAKTLDAGASHADIEAAAAPLPVGFSVAFLEGPGTGAHMGADLENSGDLENGED